MTACLVTLQTSHGLACHWLCGDALTASVIIAGPCNRRPDWFSLNLDTASPEVLRGFLGLPDAAEHINVFAHDAWGVGCLVLRMLTGSFIFSDIEPSHDHYKMGMEVSRLHDAWVYARSSA